MDHLFSWLSKNPLYAQVIVCLSSMVDGHLDSPHLSLLQTDADWNIPIPCISWYARARIYIRFAPLSSGIAESPVCDCPTLQGRGKLSFEAAVPIYAQSDPTLFKSSSWNTSSLPLRIFSLLHFVHMVGLNGIFVVLTCIFLIILHICSYVDETVLFPHLWKVWCMFHQCLY